jgi:tripartite-type tricarboxylate transporter receptor subunit TctC
MRFTPALPHWRLAQFVRGALFKEGARAWPGRSGRRRFIAHTLAGAAGAATGVFNFVPETYPAHTVTIVVPWPPGTAPDGIARIASVKLAARLRQTFVVGNRPGAASATGIASVAKAAPDGVLNRLGLAGIQ